MPNLKLLAALLCSPALAVAQSATPTTVVGSQSVFAPNPTNDPIGCNPQTASGDKQSFTVNYNVSLKPLTRQDALADSITVRDG